MADAIDDFNAKNDISVFRIGLTFPYPDKLVADFIRNKKRILVVEEIEPYLENEAKRVAKENDIKTQISGKAEHLFSRAFEYDPGMVRKIIAEHFGLDYQPKSCIRTDDLPQLPKRPPTLCAGCPHRATLYAVTRAAGMTTLFPLEIGCYALGYIEPLKASDLCICMGSAIPSGCGISRVTGEKTVCFLGDSSFFHSGMTGLANAVHHRHNVLVVIMDNGTTAMTVTKATQAPIVKLWDWIKPKSRSSRSAVPWG